MEKLTTAQIRSTFLNFFQRHGHTIVPSSSLIPGNDPTLLFSNSGMVQFKDVFLGAEQRPYSRATTSQKCLRVSGKHNDLEEVGPSPRHQTFFEMLGNFSFGDYFKQEAISLSWKLLTEEFKLPVERLWFTVFEGEPGVPADEEAVNYWVQAGADPDRVLRFGRKDNFWVMGDTGPCGPCSEITVYLGDDLSKMRPDGVNSDDPDYVEIWNNVFMQFDRATMTPLPRPSIDTGMGLERMAMVLQGVKATYDTDAFTPLIERTIGLLGSDEAHYRANFAPYRAVADHSRAVAFLIADGVLPGNTGRSYVLRRLLRRAVYQGRTIGFERPFLAQVVATVIDQMGEHYRDLRDRREFILETTEAEEQQFLRTLSGGMVKLAAVVDHVKAAGAATIPGADAFMLKDTFGFPLDLTQKIAAEQGLEVDEAGYSAAMDEQRGRGRKAAQFKRGADAELWLDRDLPHTSFVGYDSLVAGGKVLALLVGNDDVSVAQVGQDVQIVLDRTPFYGESGGQVGDTGVLRAPGGLVRVRDTQKPVSGLYVHYGTVEEGQIGLGDTVTSEVDAERRGDIQRNHTATHLLHRALRDVLGEHAAQAGSLVSPERLRFDFSHQKPIGPEQLRDIERRVNAWVRADGTVTWDETDYQSALDKGAIALFGEKYGDRVRVVHVRREGEPVPGSALVVAAGSVATRDSVELCGGTHVGRTGEIGQARVLSEGSIGSGLRRIEMTTGRGAEALAEEEAAALRTLGRRLNVPPAQVAERVDGLLEELRQRQQELEKLRTQAARSAMSELLGQVQHVNGAPLLVARVEASDAQALRAMGDWLRDKLGSAVIVLGSAGDGKPQLLAVVTPDLVTKGYHAGNLVKALAPIVGGGGGGRPDMAQAGGRDESKLDDALAQAPAIVARQSR